MQESKESVIADEFGISEELDGEYKEAAVAARTIQGMPGVMDSQSKPAKRDATQVAAERVEGAQGEAQEERKWQSFMAEHFGESATAHMSTRMHTHWPCHCGIDPSIRMSSS